MGSSGKTTQSTQQVQIPADVLARYNSVNAQAQQAASAPFQQYTGEFVAPLNQTQQQGVGQTTAYSQAAQPYYGAAAGLTLGSAASSPGPLTSQQISQYMNPFTNAVINPTVQALQQQQGQQLAQQQAQAIQSGGFGDRAQLARAQLQGQQALGLGQAISPLLQQNYQQALTTATGQQQLGLQEQQQMLAAAQAMAGIGTAAQTSGLTGAQALLSAGTLGQQTQQAQDTAVYQQFLQQQGYPFQTAQFLANIAEGTGALSGSTTTGTQQAPFFSDRRLKENVTKIGKTNDGLGIYKYNYKGDNQKQIGLMADEVEDKHPEAVGLSGGYKTVDYDAATADSERPEKRNGGGLDLNWMGGAVHDTDERGHYATAGSVDYTSGGMGSLDPYLASYLQQQRSFLPGIGGQSYASTSGTPGSSAAARVPTANVPIARGLNAPSLKMGQQQTGLQTLAGDVNDAAKVGSAVETAKGGLDKAVQWAESMKHSSSIPSSLRGEPQAPSGTASSPAPAADMPQPEMKIDWDTGAPGTANGGARMGYAAGGVNPYALPDPTKGVGSVIQSDEDSQEKPQQLKTASLSGGPSSGGLGSDIMGAAGIVNAGSTLAGAASKFLPMLLAAKDGGAINRHGYATDGTVSSGLGAASSNDNNQPPPISDSDRDLAIRTIASETGGDPDETLGIASVINNRFKSGKYKSYGEVVQAPSQFEPWSNPDGSNYPMKIDPTSDRYKNAASAFDRALQGEDPTNGATHFWSPSAQAALGRNVPDWAQNSDGVDIGKTRFHKLDPSELPAYSPVRANLGGQPAQQPGLGGTTYDGTPARYASLGDVMSDVLPKSVPTSGDFWVPALSGIGSMLASRSPFLGVALGEGLVGGVAGYQAQQRQDMEMAKQTMDLINNRFVEVPDGKGGIVFHNKMTGEFVTPQQLQVIAAGMFKAIGLDPAKYGFDPTVSAQAPIKSLNNVVAGPGAPSGGTTTTQQQQPSAQQQTTTGTTTDTGKAAPSAVPTDPTRMNAAQLQDLYASNPEKYGLTQVKKLDDQINETQSSLLTARAMGNVNQENALRSQLTTQQQQRLKLLSDATNLQSEKNKGLQEGDTKAYTDYQAEAGTRGKTFSQQLNAWDRLGNIYHDYQTGRGTDWKANLAGWADSMGLPQVVKDGVANASDFDQAMKLVTDQAVSELRDSKLVRAPASSMKTINVTLATPTTQPGAVYSLIGNAKGILQYNLDRDKNFYKEVPRGENPSQWLVNYEDNHPDDLKKSVADAFNKMPTIKGVPSETYRQNYTTYGKYGYKIPDTEDQSTVNAPAAPAAPKVGTQMEGYEFMGGNPADKANWKKVQ